MTDASEALRGSLAGMGAGLGAIVALFRETVGPELAAVAMPTSLRDGTLTIRCSSASWAQAIGLREHDLLSRLSDHLGPGVVTRIRTRAGLPAAPPPPLPPPPLPPVSTASAPALDELVQDIADPTLRARVRAAAEATARRRAAHGNP